ncbi:prolyl aminopeptidase [Amycolatopsis magusensis]|uniref:prolyl aminopeptidase n=1 Tax=Amycolatopsis magusensis TaxID=882444 RepID=UPI0024A96953|nr:prolyl aminopeptidase [Amycolatopsis magusensis]MDI5980416.1 prolyl aminopeptidase [Amycolatopsis magusensis]
MVTGLHPETEPYRHGMLDVGDGNSLYWEECGNPAGKPALVLHGGPGSGCTPGARRLFDPERFRVVLFDQRNCGRSTPHASEPDIDLSRNTTHHLVADIEALRTALGIESWLVSGASWGSVLGLVYAERHPERVTGMLHSGVATGRRLETDLLTRGLGAMFPEAYARFRELVPDGEIAAGYHRLLFDPDPEVRERAARAWCDWEDAIVPTAPGPSPRYASPEFRMAFARIVTHYFANGSWLAEGAVLRDAGKLAGIPGVIVQGVLDLSNLVGTPWELARAWPGAELVLVDDTGHNNTPGLDAARVAALDRL